MKHRIIKIKTGEIPSDSAQSRTPAKESAQGLQAPAGFTDIAGTEM